MKGDFSRITFDPARPYSHVLMQQGRVLVDADWNELNDILLHYQRGLAADLIGPHGGPIYAEGGKEYVGFGVAREGTKDLAIYSGHYYVDGILCVAERGPSGVRTVARRYREQSFLSPEERKQDLPPSFLVYLDVWERHVTALENALIREVALGGPDTSSRAEVVWQVKLLTGDSVASFLNSTCETFPLEDFRQRLRGNPAMLQARAKKPASDIGPCITPPEARYRRNENQLYRVEIHRGGEGPAAPATFKWSRENGSVVVRWLDRHGNDLVVTGIRDDRRGFAGGDWIELVDDDLDLGGRPGVMVKVTRVEGEILTIDPPTDGQVVPDVVSLKNPRVRRWDQREVGGDPKTLTGGAVPVKEGSTEDFWIPLEDGIEVRFQPPAPGEQPHRYRTGDYWLIPARVATGDVEWPPFTGETPLALPPRGIQHHYAPLSLFPAGGPQVDLRKGWRPLATCSSGRFEPSFGPSTGARARPAVGSSARSTVARRRAPAKKGPPATERP